MSLKENSSYVKGLLDGLEIDLTTKEGKVISALADLCDALAAKVDELEETTKTLQEYVEEIDYDLGDVEEELIDITDDLYDGDDEYEDDSDYDDDEDEDEEEEDDEDEDDDDDFLCVMCPHCGDTIYIENTVDPEKLICPSCQKPLVDDKDEDDE